MAKYLEQRRRGWYAVLDVPAKLKNHFGKKRLVKTLETDSRSEAERKVLPVIARWKAEFEAAKSGTSIPLEQLALEWANDLKNARDPDIRDIGYDLIEEKANKLAKLNPTSAATFRLIALGEAVPLNDHVDPWLLRVDNVGKTIDMKRSDVQHFLQTFKVEQQVTKRAVQKWADALIKDAGLSPPTARRHISSCRGFWSYLQRAGIIDRDDDPFHDAVSRASQKNKAKPDSKRRPFRPDELGQLYREASRANDPQLQKLIWMAIWTGCRIEELCSLKVSDVSEDFFQVMDAKTGAGNRLVPTHSRLRPLLEQLCRSSTDGFVLSGLTFNKYGDRSNAIGKRFGRLKSKLGMGPTLVFHSIRKTVATQLENAGVPESVSADILGHEKKTMTYGLYSGGTDLKIMKAAVEKLSYPDLICPLE